MKAGRCPGKAGEYQGLGRPDTPRKFGSLQEPFLAVAELCLKSCAPFGGSLIPNGEAMLAEQFHAAAAAAKTTAAVDEIARLTWRAHAEGQSADAKAEAISGALQARRAAFSARGNAHGPVIINRSQRPP